MALSNWDTLAFGSDGKPCEGEFEAPNTGAKIEIYKSQIHVHHPDMWTDNTGYTKPIIAVMHKGDVRVAGFNIEATRYAPQHGVFVVASCQKNPKNKDFYEEQYFAGIGCSGYVDSCKIYVERMGLEPDEGWSGGCSIEGGVRTENICRMKDGKLEEYDVPAEFVLKDDELWEGVREDTYAGFMKWLESEDCEEFNCTKDFKAWLEKVKASTPQRFNQGNAFISKAVGTPLESSEPGKAEKPILLKVMNGGKS